MSRVSAEIITGDPLRSSMSVPGDELMPFVAALDNELASNMVQPLHGPKYEFTPFTLAYKSGLRVYGVRFVELPEPEGRIEQSATFDVAIDADRRELILISNNGTKETGRRTHPLGEVDITIIKMMKCIADMRARRFN